MGINQKTKPAELHYSCLTTPLGLLEICASELGIRSIHFREKALHPESKNNHIEMALSQLISYFAGQTNGFDLLLDAQGTEFQKQVWHQLYQIPYGQTCSYSDIAKRLNNKKAVRAVGAANGKNPISIVVPCHRVIGANGTLTGYAGGLERKAWLLRLEKGDLFL
jgi:methylated-DNA-[protein]-cysteine S-methyltransferase